MQKFSCCDNYMISFYLVLGALLSFLFAKEISKLYLLHSFCILYVIQVLVGFIRKILLVLAVLNDVQELAVTQKDLLSTGDQI